MNWDKYENFSEDEFTCKCGCGTCNVDELYMDRLQLARNIAKTIDPEVPFPVRSGCRCLIHNVNEGGHPHSDHIATETLKCTAGDIETANHHNAAVVLIAMIKAGFTHFGIGKDFIHSDMSKKVGRWLY